MSKFLGKKGKKNGKVADVPERKMPEAASLDSLIRGMESIVNRQNGVVTTQDYMELYSYVYKSCSKPGKNNYTQVKPMSSADDSGYPLYNFVKEFLAKHANGLLCKFDDVHGLQLLDLYNKLWTEYQFSANVINGIFSYLNRHWIKRKVDEGAQDVLEIYNLSIKCWEDHLFAYICRRVSGAMINLITKERKGELITTSYITGTLQSYMEMGINYKLIQPQNGSSSKKRLDVYRLHFEIQFLKETREFYKEESQQFLSDNNIIEYVRKVDARLKEERLRVDRYLDPSTIEGLISVLDDALIKDYIERFKAEFERLVEQNAVDDIEKVYKLCSRVPDSLEALRLTFEKLVCKKGYDAVKNCAEAGNDPKAYITAIIQVLKTYTDMTLQAFANESGFVRALDKACINYINNNSICEDGKKSERSPDLLAKYCDILLRKSSKALQESEVEDALNDVMTVFKFIEDKDVFQQYYSKTVAKRLVFDMSASEDAEHSFISKLKNMCGFEYTSRLQRMFTDKTVSSELTLTYKKQGDNLVSKPKVDMTVMILAEGVWPFSGGEQFNIPAILGDSQAEFTSFYTAKHSGRKLNFLNNLSRGEVVCNWPKGKRFTFTTTIAQMSILLMYNDVDEHTLRELVESIGLRKDAMVQALIALVKIEILKLESGKLNPEMDMDTKIVINPKFTSRKLKVDLSRGVANRGETKKEVETMQKDLEEDRKMIIQAAIVRVMKMRKSCKHQQLVGEVIKLLSVRFNPSIKVIRLSIDSLIEKEYMKRSAEDQAMYEYIS